jgi:CHASE3 domain sensor protein
MENTHRVEHTRMVLTGLTDIVATMLNADTERRNYLQFREKEDLNDYNTAIQALDAQIHRLRLEKLDDAAQQQRLTELESLVIQWRSSLDQPLSSDQRNQASALTSDSLRNQNQQLRTEIQQMIDEMQTNETDRLQQWINQVEKNTHYQILTEISSTILSFSILVGTVGLLHRQMIKRQQADMKRQQAESYQRTLAQEKELSELKLHFFFNGVS